MSSSEAIDMLNAHACGAERRQQPRVFVNWRTAILLKSATDTVRVFGRTRDASASGVCVECEQTLAVLTPVVIIIELPAKIANVPPDIIQVSAEIKNCILAKDKYRIGMQIIEFHGNAQHELLKHIQRQPRLGE